MPRRSSGCEKCRKRKLLCDEAKPACQRCSKMGFVCPGYRPPAEKDFQFVDQTRYAAMRSEAMAGTISSRYVHRAQRFNTFLDQFLPGYRTRPAANHFTYLLLMPQADLSSPLLGTSVDALCLAQIGTLRGDDRCLRECQASYTVGLRLLANELCRSEAHQSEKQIVLAAIVILALCELFDIIAKDTPGGEGWLNHVNGAERYLEACGPEIIKTDLGRLLFQNIRHSSLLMGITKRRSSMFSQPRWLALSRAFGCGDSSIALYDAAIKVPTLLERADSLADDIDMEVASSLCKAVCASHAELTSWLEDRERDPRNTYSIVDATTLAAFASLCSDDLFDPVFNFASPEICQQYQIYWITSLLLNTVSLQLDDHGHQTQPDILGQWAPETIRQEAFINASSFCCSIPYCFQAEVVWMSRLSTFLLRLAQSYFEKHGHERELQWCCVVSQLLNSHKTVDSTPIYFGGAGVSEPLRPVVQQRQASPGPMICRVTGKVIHNASISLGGPSINFPTAYQYALPQLRPSVLASSVS